MMKHTALLAAFPLLFASPSVAQTHASDGGTRERLTGTLLVEKGL